MKNTNREIWVGKSRFYFGEDNILYETIVGDVDEKIALAMKEAADKLRNLVEGDTCVLVDLEKAGRQTAKARIIGIKALEEEKLKKIALLGTHPVAKIIASFVIGFTKKKGIRFFSSREEALKWLEE